MNYRLAVIHAISILNGERLNAGRSHHRQAVYAMARRIEGQEHTRSRKHLGRWLSRAIATLLAEEVLISERRGFIGLSSKARRRLVDVRKQLGPFDSLSRSKKIQYLKAIAGSSTRRASAKSRSKTVSVDALKKEIQALHEQLKRVQAENANLREQEMDKDEARTLDEYLGQPVDTPDADLQLDPEYSHTSRQTAEPVITPQQARSASFGEAPRTPIRPGPRYLIPSSYSVSGSVVDVHSGRCFPINRSPDVLCLRESVVSPDPWHGYASSDDGLYEGRGEQPTRMDGGLPSPRMTSPQRPETREPHSSGDMLDHYEDLEGLIQDCSTQPNNDYSSPAEIEELRKKLAETKADLERWKAKEAQTTDVYFTQTTKLATTRCELEETNVELKSLRDYLARVENEVEWQGESARDRVIGLEAELRQVSRELATAKEKIQAAMEAMGPAQSNVDTTGSPRVFASRRRRNRPVRGKVSSRELRESGIAMLTHVLTSH